MVEIADIRDAVSLENWLADKPRELAVLLAHRAAARVMPIYWARGADPSTGGDVTDIAMWRILLTSKAGAMYATRRVGEAAIEASEAAHDAAAHDGARAAALAAFAAHDNAFFAFAAPQFTADRAHVTSSNAAAAAAVAAIAAKDARTDIWNAVKRDAEGYLRIDMRAPLSLWQDGMPPEISEAWGTTRTALSKRIEAGDTGWQFWIDWYEAQLSGADQNWEMLKEIVLIPDEDWKQGAAHVNAMIAEIVEKYKPDDVERPLKTLLAEMEAGSKASIARVKGAMIANRSELPPTFDAVLGFISLEVQRLQNRNYRDDADEEESKRQIRTLTTLYQAVEGLQTLVPVADTMSEVDAEKAERLSRLFLNSFRKWPRENVDEVADSTYRFGLVGASSYVLTLLGMQPGHALAAASVFFAGKRIVETAKAAKDLFNPGGAP